MKTKAIMVLVLLAAGIAIIPGLLQDEAQDGTGISNSSGQRELEPYELDLDYRSTKDEQALTNREKLVLFDPTSSKGEQDRAAVEAVTSFQDMANWCLERLGACVSEYDLRPFASGTFTRQWNIEVLNKALGEDGRVRTVGSKITPREIDSGNDSFAVTVCEESHAELLVSSPQGQSYDDVVGETLLTARVKRYTVIEETTEAGAILVVDLVTDLGPDSSCVNSLTSTQ